MHSYVSFFFRIIIESLTIEFVFFGLYYIFILPLIITNHHTSVREYRDWRSKTHIRCYLKSSDEFDRLFKTLNLNLNPLYFWIRAFCDGASAVNCTVFPLQHWVTVLNLGSQADGQVSTSHRAVCLFPAVTVFFLRSAGYSRSQQAAQHSSLTAGLPGSIVNQY